MFEDKKMHFPDKSDTGIEKIAKILTEEFCPHPNDLPVTKDIVRVALYGMPDYFSAEEYHGFLDRINRELNAREVLRMVDRGYMQICVDETGEMIVKSTALGKAVYEAEKNKPR